jgi:hypothetical protein
MSNNIQNILKKYGLSNNINHIPNNPNDLNSINSMNSMNGLNSLSNKLCNEYGMIRLTDPKLMLNNDGHYLICKYNNVDYITSQLIDATINDYGEIVVITESGTKLLVIPNNKQDTDDIVNSIVDTTIIF